MATSLPCPNIHIWSLVRSSSVNVGFGAVCSFWRFVGDDGPAKKWSLWICNAIVGI